MITGHHKKQAKKRREDVIVDTYSVDVLAHLDKTVDSRSDELIPPPDGTRGEMKPITISFDNIVKVSSVRIFVPDDTKSVDSRQAVLKSLFAIREQFDGQVPVLDPQEDMKITDEAFVSLVKKIESFETRLQTFNFPNTEPLKLFTRKQELHEKLSGVRRELREAQSLIQMNELKCRKRVLRRMGYCTASDVIETKGRVACEITSGDELLLTEMLFNGVFNEMTPHQINALLSCFVFEEKTDTVPKLTEELQAPLRLMQDLAKRIAAVSRESKLELDEDEYIQKFRPNVMDVVYAWSKGASFAQICKMTDAFEGSIIRCMRRLEELLRQMCQAAKVIGNADLENKFADADKCIKRDIVFAASLYL